MSKTDQIDVLFIARRFPPSVGGMEKFAYDLSESLAQKAKITKLTWGGSNKWLPLVIPLLFIKAFWKLLTKRSISVIHMQDAMLSPIGWLLHVIFRKPFVVVAHGLDLTYENRFYQKVIPVFTRRAASVISISQATNDEAMKRGINKEKALAIPLGVTDFDNNNMNESEIRDILKNLGVDPKNKMILLTVGRLVRRKGVEWFIRNVMPSLVKHNPDIIYLIVGEGAERKSIEEAISSNKLTANVFMLGEVSEKAKWTLYKQSDLFIMPNIKITGDMEGFGIVAHEAAISELPVVASNLEGIADAIQNQKNGFLVKFEDELAFQKVIEDLLKNNLRRKEFGKQARLYTIQEFGWERVAERYIETYKHILAKSAI